MAQYDPELVARVVAMVLAGQSISSVAREYRIPKGTVSAWVKRQGSVLEAGEAAVGEGGVATVATQKKERIGDLIIDNLEAQLEATRAIARIVQEGEWIRKQPASELAVLFGVISDKSFRILEALPDDEGAE
jgi:transposase-like protein